MDTRDTLLVELSGTSLDNLCKILAAVRLRQADKYDNHDNNSTSQNADNDTVYPPDQEPHNPKAPKEVHVGIFAQAYATNTLAFAHADLYANFDAVDPSDMHQYMRMVSNIDITQWPCFVVCTGETMPSIAVLHRLAVHKHNLKAKSHYNVGTYAFLHNANPGEQATTVEILPAWFGKVTITTSTYGAFSNTIKSAPRAAMIDTLPAVNRLCHAPTGLGSCCMTHALPRGRGQRAYSRV